MYVLASELLVTQANKVIKSRTTVKTIKFDHLAIHNNEANLIIFTVVGDSIVVGRLN